MTRLIHNIGLKLAALFLALVIWFVVSAPRRGPMSERAFAAPLAVVELRRDLVITTQVPDTVNVRLRGRVSDLRALSSQNLEVTVNLSFAAPGDALVTLRPQAINVPPDVEVVSIDPNKLRFHVEQLRQRVVPVRAFLVGNLPQGMIWGEPTVTPNQVLISGPSTQVRNVSEVGTERIIMTGRTETFTQTAAVVSDTPLVRIVEPVAVLVTVPILSEIGPPLPGAADSGATETTATDTAQAPTTRKSQ
jgi:YbbR domain-containing protein